MVETAAMTNEISFGDFHNRIFILEM